MKLSCFLEKTALNRNDLTIFHDVSEAIKMVKKDIDLLSVVNGCRWTEDEYSAIYLAVSPFLYFLDPKKCSREQYGKICLKAAKRHCFFELYNIKIECLSSKVYKEICIYDFNQHIPEETIGHLLSQTQLLKQEHYAELFIKIVRKEGLLLRYVKENHLPAKKYIVICTTAVKNNSAALEYVNSNLCSAEEYIRLCCMAVKNNYITLNYAKIQTPELLLVYIKSYITQPFRRESYFIKIRLRQFLSKMIKKICSKMALQ
jgi:hypothetical protein